jgi:hypothetical protein
MLTPIPGVHIKDAYKFLIQNYHEGDRICLLGFSRGAYTVRCLAGMLHKVGLLPASNGAQVNFAYDFYKDDTEKGWKLSADFKATFCTDVNVYFLGLFDCVASVGLIPRKLPFSKSPTNSIHYFRHAMALDEHRAKFKVCQYGQQDLDMKCNNTIDNTLSTQLKRSGLFNCFGAKEYDPNAPRNQRADSTATSFSDDTAVSKTGVLRGKKSERQNILEAKFDAQDEANRRHEAVKTDALEVWFMGAHADVGGGSYKNDCRHMLSRIPLRWMLRQCFECDTGIQFDTARLAEQGLDVQTLWPIYQPATKPTAPPPPALMEKKEKEILAPLQRRSMFLPIGPVDNRISDAPTEEDLNYILPSESTEDQFDCTARMNDQLKDAKGWWPLELWPIKVRVLTKSGEGWEKKVSVNLGRHRAIRDREPKLHWTVLRMIGKEEYNIKARTCKSVKWVEVV